MTSTPLLLQVIAAIESIFHAEGLSGSREDMIKALSNKNQRLLHQLHVKSSNLVVLCP